MPPHFTHLFTPYPLICFDQFKLVGPGIDLDIAPGAIRPRATPVVTVFQDLQGAGLVLRRIHFDRRGGGGVAREARPDESRESPPAPPTVINLS